MVQAIVKIGEYQDRILSIVKGKYGLKNKSDAINFVIQKFGNEILEPELRPKYLRKLRKIEKEKSIVFKDIGELRSLTGKK